MVSPTTYTDRKAVGKTLQRLRKEAGYSSAKKFAEHVGLNPNTYTQYEQGITGFNYEQAWLLADALGCSMDDLGGRDWPPGGDALLSPDEAGLVGDYRRMEPEERETIAKTAHAFALAGEAKKEGALEPAGVDAGDVR